MIYEIANLRILIKNRYLFTTKFCEKYLSPDQDSPVDITAMATEEALAEEKAASPDFSIGYIENICIYRDICLQIPLFNRMLVHCSVLDYDGDGYAFLGKSGTGKSTHSKLWLKHLSPVKVVNGDKPILEYKEGKFIAYGTPWMGKEQWGENTSVELKGFCFLEQAKENAIRELSPAEFSSRLFTQILLPQEEDSVIATLELADKLIGTVPAYLLQCDISEEAVKTSFEKMTGLPYENKKNMGEEE